jgi:hypothetical protein
MVFVTAYWPLITQQLSEDYVPLLTLSEQTHVKFI